MPSLQEQKSIGQFFENFDNLITLHHHQLDLLKEQKKGLLQKLFPKDGSNVPELRFPEFTAPWEQRKLGQIVQITMGQSPDGSTYSETPSDYILIQGNADLLNGWVNPRIWTTQLTKIAEPGDLIMSVRAPAGAMGKTSYKAVIGRGVAAIKGNEFLFQLLSKMDSEGFWKPFSSGSTFESLNSEDIKKAPILLPSLSEQEEIGSFFSNFDNLITLHQHQLDLLKEQKKGLLQKMFPKEGALEPELRFPQFK
ncbi:MAG: restriction endonuclease subunit S [Allobaculum sp.]|nr:restriction endonuclease subunit S [Allobaculum sp.]